MKIVVASKSPVKLAACKKVFGEDHEYICIAAPSGVNEQPEGHAETRLGAANRMRFILMQVPEADIQVSMESGIVEDDAYSWYNDVSAVICSIRGRKRCKLAGVEHRLDEMYVNMARQRGFDKTTVGEVLLEEGIVTSRDDPHIDLCGVSRVDVLAEILRDLVGSGEGCGNNTSKEIFFSLHEQVGIPAPFDITIEVNNDNVEIVTGDLIAVYVVKDGVYRWTISDSENGFFRLYWIINEVLKIISEKNKNTYLRLICLGILSDIEQNIRRIALEMGTDSNK